MGAAQFRLLTSLGLREHHSVLDFGCGSLRAGRLLIPYLLPGRYYGLEPNRWLIEDGISGQLGAELIELKLPIFLCSSDFSAAHFGVQFDLYLGSIDFLPCRARYRHQASRAPRLARRGRDTSPQRPAGIA